MTSNSTRSESLLDHKEGEAVLSESPAKQDSVVSGLTTSSLMKCQRICARGLRWKKPIQDRLLRPITGATKLRHHIENRTYKPRKLDQVLISEHGKPRLIRPQTITDRTIQTWLTINYLIPLSYKHMIKDSYACLKGRGLDCALNRVQEMMTKAPMDAWIGQFDFKGYFASIDHKLVIETLTSRTNNELIKYLLTTILSGNMVDDKSGVGLELGACTSQISATMFPDYVDRTAMNTPGCLGYGRYMDDGFFIAESREAAMRIMDNVRCAAGKLNLTINEKKTHINRITHPVVFCKHRFEKSTEGVRRHIRSPQRKIAMRHIKRVRRLSNRTQKTIDMSSVYASYRGYLNRDSDDLLYLLNNANEGW